MFLPRKIYCRVFQEVFHMAIPFLPYRKPALLHHTDALVPLLGRKGISRILLVTDPVVRGNKHTAFGTISKTGWHQLYRLRPDCIQSHHRPSRRSQSLIQRPSLSGHHRLWGRFFHGLCPSCGGADCRPRKPWTKEGILPGMEKTPLAHCHSHHRRHQAVKPHWQQSSPTVVHGTNIPSTTLYSFPDTLFWIQKSREGCPLLLQQPQAWTH